MKPALVPARRVLALGPVLALVLLAAVTACGADSGEESGPAAKDDAWSFTDDTGRKVTLPEKPTRIAGLTNAVSSLWSYGIEPVAAFGFTSMSADSSFDGKEIAKVTEVGRTYGKIDLEALAASRPDLIVTHVYPQNGGELTGKEVLYGFADQTQVEAVRKIAPIVALEMSGKADGVVVRTNKLAESLGADFSSGTLVQARKDYEAAAARLAKASRKGLTVMAEAAYADEGLYVAKAPDDPSLAYYAELGVDFPNPGGTKYFWQTATWEQVDRHRTDVVLNSTRAMSIPEVMKQPTFAALPAAKAGQVFHWNSQNMDYVAQARNMNYLAKALERSRKVT